MDAEIDAIYTYWFGDLLTNPDAESRNELWFMGGQTVDNEIRERFGPLVERALAGELDAWTDTPRGSTALIILLDQFPLNIYRGQARAFDGEQRAVDVCLAGIAAGQDQTLSFDERAFFYLPLEHSEHDEHQELSVRYFTQLLEDAPAHKKEGAQYTLQYAIDHKAIVDQFGRYPHRNRVLGRASTEEELAYLADGGATYGQ